MLWIILASLLTVLLIVPVMGIIMDDDSEDVVKPDIYRRQHVNRPRHH
jgi:hypothetical protein